MASFDFDPASGRYHLRFRWGKSYKRSLRLPDDKAARRRCQIIDETIQDLRLGKRTIPPGIDPGEFIVAGGIMPPMPEPVEPTADARSPTLGALIGLYEANALRRAKEATTRETEGYHVAHLLRGLGADFPLDRLDLAAAQGYADRRSRETWRDKPIGPRTILKEIATLRVLWNWGRRRNLLGTFPFALKDLEFERGGDREPFRTREEIEAMLARGATTREERARLWECLYLTLEEVHEVLTLVHERALHPFIHPMFALAAMTGARRSEICRARVEDFDFRHRVVTIREKKRKRGRDSFRKVDMNAPLEAVLRDWFATHPGGPHAITKDGSPLTVKMATDHFKRTLRGTKWAVVPGFHTFRHSFASILASRGVDEPTIDRWMGHQTPEQRERYRHLFPRDLKRSIEFLAATGRDCGSAPAPDGQ